MGTFRKYLLESPSSITFLQKNLVEYIRDGKKLTYPHSSEEIVISDSHFPNGYDMMFERINYYLLKLEENPGLSNIENYPSLENLKLLKEKVPVIGPGASAKIIRVALRNPIPIWDIIGNKIFLIDKDGNTYSAYDQSDYYELCNAYKYFLIYALKDYMEDEILSNRVKQSIII